jgi:hypothetical protein
MQLKSKKSEKQDKILPANKKFYQLIKFWGKKDKKTKESDAGAGTEAQKKEEEEDELKSCCY